MSISLSSLPLHLDEMRVEDIPDIMTIERRVFSATWTSGIYQRELTANPWSHYYVIRTAHPDLPPILAYGGVWQMDQSAHIPTIATHPAYQGRKLGSYLLLNLLITGQKLGCTEATLEVRASNYAAQQLYLKHGFEVAGLRYHYYNDNGEDAVIMTRPSLDIEMLQTELALAEKRLWLFWRHLAHSPSSHQP